VRNTNVVDIASGLKEYSVDVDLNGPWVNRAGGRASQELNMISELGLRQYYGVALVVKHFEFMSMGVYEVRKLCV